MTSKKAGLFHIYNTPFEQKGVWIIEKMFAGELVGVFISKTKEEADSKLRSLTLFRLSITDEAQYEFEKDGEFFYITIPQIDRDSGTYSYSVKRMVNKEIVKFVDGIETTVQAIQQQKKICGIQQPIIKPKKKKILVRPRAKRAPIKKRLEVNEAKQLEMYLFVRNAMLQGFSKLQIQEHLVSELPELTEKQCATMISSAQTYYKNNVVDSQDIPSIIQSHIEKYEKIFRYFYETGNTIGMNRALLLKEKILGLHNKDNILEFNQENNFNVQAPEYVLSVLDDNEKDRLNHYLSKINLNEIK